MSLFKLNKDREKAVKSLEEYLKKGGDVKSPEPLLYLYKAYSKTIYTKKADYYLKVLLNNFPFNKEVIPLKLNYIKRMLSVKNWSEALFYLIDLEDKGYSKKYPIIIFYIGKAYYQKGTFEIAAEYFRKYLKIKPDFLNYTPEDIFAIGKSFYAVTDYNSALKVLMFFVNVYPKNPNAAEALYLIGEIFYLQKKYRLSALFLNEVINKYSDFPIANKARIRIADSVSHLTKIEMEQLKIPYYLKKPERVYREIIRKATNLKDKHMAFIKLIEMYNKRGRIEDGLFELFEYLKGTLVDPEGENIYRKYFDKFMKEAKDNKRILFYFLRTKKDTAFLKNYEIEKLAEIFRKMNLYKIERLLLNRLYILSTKKEEKKKTLIKLLRNSYALLDWNEFRKNIRLFQRLYPLEKLPVDIKMGLAEYYFSKDMLDDAYNILTSGKREFSKTSYYTKALILLLKISVKKSRWREANSILKLLSNKKITKEKDKLDVLVPAAITYINTNQTTRAINTLKQILKFIPENKDWALFQLGRIYFRKGDLKTSKIYWDRLKSVYPKSFWTKQIEFVEILSKKENIDRK